MVQLTTYYSDGDNTKTFKETPEEIQKIDSNIAQLEDKYNSRYYYRIYDENGKNSSIKLGNVNSNIYLY